MEHSNVEPGPYVVVASLQEYGGDQEEDPCDNDPDYYRCEECDESHWRASARHKGKAAESDKRVESTYNYCNERNDSNNRKHDSYGHIVEYGLVPEDVRHVLHSNENKYQTDDCEDTSRCTKKYANQDEDGSYSAEGFGLSESCHSLGLGQM